MNKVLVVNMRIRQDPRIDMTVSDNSEIQMGVNADSRAEVKVIDALDSTSTVAALSANQGRVLNEKIENSGFITEEVDPTVHPWAKESTKPSYTADEVGAVDVDNELSLAAIDAMFAAVFGG